MSIIDESSFCPPKRTSRSRAARSWSFAESDASCMIAQSSARRSLSGAARAHMDGPWRARGASAREKRRDEPEAADRFRAGAAPHRRGAVRARGGELGDTRDREDHVGEALTRAHARLRGGGGDLLLHRV